MSSYLEAYGAEEAQRAKRIRLIKRASVALILLLIVSGVAYAVFKNYPEEQQVKAFLETLRKQDYQTAYRMWGCTESTPCRDYSYQKFLEDWGSKGSHGDIGSAHI